MDRFKPLIGRDEELDALRSGLADPDCSAIVVAGKSGAGRSSLLLHMVHELSEQSTEPHVIRATAAASTVPFGAVARMLPERVEVLGSYIELFRSTVALWSRSERPLVIVDDAHLLDPQSAALLHELVVQRHVCLLLSVLENADPPDAVTAVWKDLDAKWVEITDLTDQTFGELLTTWLDGPVDGVTVRTISEAAAGNLLLARELTSAAVTTKVLTRAEDNVWELLGELSLSTRLRHLISCPLSKYSPAVRGVGEWLSLADGTLPLPTLQRLCGTSAIEQAEDAGLVCVRSAVPGVPDQSRTCVQLLHPLQGMLLREELSWVRRRQMYAQIAEAVLVDAAVADRELVRAIRWLGLTDTEPDRALVVYAARTARVARDYGVALELAKLAGVDRRGAGSELLGIAAECCMWLGKVAEAEEYYLSARQRAEDPAAYAELGVGVAANMFLITGRISSAAHILHEATMSLPPNHAMHGAATALRTLLALSRGQLNECLAMLDRLTLDSQQLLAMKVGVLIMAGQPLEAVSVANWPRPTVDPISRGPQNLDQHMKCLALCYAGEYAEARWRAHNGYHSSVTDRLRPEQADWAYVRGEIELLAGDPESALRWLHEAACVMRRYPTMLGPSMHARCLCCLVEVLTSMGRHAEAQQVVREIDQLPLAEHHVPSVHTARARTADTDEGRRAALDALEQDAAHACRNGATLIAARAWLDLARLGRPRRGAAGLAELAPTMEGPLPGRWVRYARALEASEPEQLVGCAEDLAEQGMVPFAAEAFAAAASSYRDAGEINTAVLTIRAGMRKSQAVAAALNALNTDTISTELPLTGREREIAVLSASGATASQTARKLAISRRTVESHLQHTYTKLGIHSREQLAEILGESCR